MDKEFLYKECACYASQAYNTYHKHKLAQRKENLTYKRNDHDEKFDFHKSKD